MRSIISTVDYPGEIALLIPLYGCFEPFCEGCINPEYLEDKENDVWALAQEIQDNLPYIDAIVLGGGDPLASPDVMHRLAEYAKTLDLKVGIQTSNLSPTSALFILRSGNFDYILFTTQKVESEEEYQRLADIFRYSKVDFVTKVLGNDFCPEKPLGKLIKAKRI